MQPRGSKPPVVLIDNPWDGYIETFGHVETTVDEDRARDLLREFCCDEDGEPGYRPTGPAKRVRLDLANPQAEHEEQRWEPCGEGEGLEFWEVIVD